MHGSTRPYGFIDPMRNDEVFVRGAHVDARAAQEVASNGRLIDLSVYRFSVGAYAGGLMPEGALGRTGHRVPTIADRSARA
jgi:hypothetical protein